VVTFIEHQHSESVAQVFHVQKGRVVGRNGQGLQVVFAPADHADRRPERGPQDVVPLADEVQRRRDHQGAAAAVVDAKAGDPGLARPGRQHDHAAVPVRLPGRDRLGLVRAGLPPDPGALRQLGVGARAILDRTRVAAESPPNGGVGGSRRAKTGRPRVP
jgi:hypothetical protein